MRLFLITVATLGCLVATASMAQSTSSADLKGVWKGTSESIVNGASNHFNDPPASKLMSIPFTLTVDMQDGRRFSGTMASEHSKESIVGIINRAGTILWVDEDGYNVATLINPDLMEVCYLHTEPLSQVVSCIEMQRTP